MPTETIHATVVVKAKPKAIYQAWITGDGHAAMTGAGAESDPQVGGRFTAWDNYITGEHLELQPARRIVQAWRTTQFPTDAPPSRLIVLLDAVPEGTRVTIAHTEIPAGQGAGYEAGWDEHYFKPMRRYFSKAAKGKSAKKEAKKAAKAAAPKDKKPGKKKS